MTGQAVARADTSRSMLLEAHTSVWVVVAHSRVGAELKGGVRFMLLEGCTRVDVMVLVAHSRVGAE